MSYLTELDQIKHELEERFPGWAIWFVPHAGLKGATWCARPRPLLNAPSPERLAFDICAAHAAGWPALAPGDLPPDERR